MNNFHISSPIVLVMAVIALSACSTQPFSAGKPQLVAAPDTVSAQLAEAADRASTALQSLAAVESARGPAIAPAPIGDAPVELRRAITVNWTGPVDQLTQVLASRASYQYRQIGAAPPVPVVVNVNVQNRPVIEVLRDIGLQLGMRGEIRVDSTTRVVELNYAPNTGVGPAM